jgi:glycerol-3-phosphate dehydrogenase
MEAQYDVAIIGAGVVGSAIARELSRYRLRIVLIEREADAGEGISKANSGVLHAGFNVKPGSLKARFNLEGLAYFPELARELDVEARFCEKLVVAKDESEKGYLEQLLAQGRRNGCSGLSIIDSRRMRTLAPGVRGSWALHSRSTGIINPFQFTVALAEHAAENGVEVRLGSEVTAIEAPPSGGPGGQGAAGKGTGGHTDPREAHSFTIRAGGKRIRSTTVINAAGLASDRIARMIDPGFEERIYPVRGEYHILDREHADLLDMAIYPVPHADGRGLGVHLTPTTNGNILFGPSAEFIENPADTATTGEVARQLLQEAEELMPALRGRQVIKSYAGIRPKLFGPDSGVRFRDFHIAESAAAPGFLNLVGIESPGLTSAPAIARYVRSQFVSTYLRLSERDDYRPEHRGIPRAARRSPEARAELWRQDPEYGEIVCRCEGISRAELRRALENPLGARSINAVKKRSHATMGRCQSGFCLPRISRMLTDEYGIAAEELRRGGAGSEITRGWNS